jgi:hypothetical protein
VVDVVDVGAGVVGGGVVRMVAGSVKMNVGGTVILTTGGNGDGSFVVFSTGGGKIYCIFGGQQGIFVVATFSVVVVVDVVDVVSILIP